MNINQLKYFHAICEYKTVSSAAQALFVSQPTLSNALKELEEEFGTVLFKRTYRSMTLTPEGEIFFRMSKDLLNQANHIEYIMHDIGKGRKILRLGVPPMIGSLFLPRIYNDFSSKNPSIQLEITEGGKTELLNKLSNDYLDMVFISHNQKPDSTFSICHVMQLETVFCVSKNNPLSKLQTISPADLSETPLVLFKNSFFQTEIIKKFFSAEKATPQILFQTEQLSNILSMISSNAAAGFLLKPIVDEHHDLVAIPAKNQLLTDISLVWKKNSYLFNGMKDFLEYIQSTDFGKKQNKC